MLKIFVYGTLKPNEANFARFCQPHAQTIEAACTKGKLYHLPLGYPAMTLESGWVDGYLLSFTDHRILADLDELEDYQTGRSPEVNEYQRLKLPIYNPERKFLIEAWGYVMTHTMLVKLGGVALNQTCWTGGGQPFRGRSEDSANIFTASSMIIGRE